MKSEYSNLIAEDLAHVWHPCSQMKDYEAFQPLHIVKAKGSYLYTADGRKIIDAISSWWCKSLGHGHPRIKAAVKRQMDKFEHIISANTCNETLVELSGKLAGLLPRLDKVFYADNGSTAVEIAMKMSLQFHFQSGSPEKNRFLSFENAYHGETIFALAAGDCDLYSRPFKSIMPRIEKIKGIPYVSGMDSSKWERMPESLWKIIESRIEKKSANIAAIIFEPIVQGAGGMRIYSPDFLRRLRKWASKKGVHLIADEIMTGFGRTGAMLACEHAGIVPDFICLSKGLTAGWGPMSAVLTSTNIYNVFYDDYFSGKAFMHSNTYAGFALAAAAANEAMKIYKDEDVIASVQRGSRELRKGMEWAASETGALREIRSLGFICAADIVSPADGKPFPKERRAGFEFYKEAVGLGALLRPLADTIYFLPPLNSDDKILDRLAEITAKALKKSISSAKDRVC